MEEPVLNEEEQSFAEMVDQTNRAARVNYNRHRKGGNRAQAHPAIKNCSCTACQAEFPPKPEPAAKK